MKFAIALIAGVAILASVHAAPAAKNNVYIPESLKEVIAAIRGRVQDRIDELQKSREQLRELIKSATGEAKERLRESLDAITGEVQEQIKLLLEVINRAVRKNDQNYFKDGMIRRIGEYRKEAKEILQRVTEILKREATIIGEDARARMEEQRQRLIDQVQRVNEHIKQVVNEVLNGKEEESRGVDAEAYNINAGSIRAKIAELGGQLRDLTAQARAAAGVKRQEIMEQLNVVRGELVEAAKDIRNAFRDMLGREPVAYSLAANREDSYFVQTVRDLRKKLNEKLQQVKSYVEMIKGAHGLLKDQLKAGLETAKGELRTLKEEILEKVYEEVNKPIAEDSNDA